MFRRVNNDGDKQHLQNDLDKLVKLVVVIDINIYIYCHCYILTIIKIQILSDVFKKYIY